jgi:alkylation response protein AidB-like acyl-CoA dehydrogenase
LGFEEGDKMIRFDIPSEEARLLRETAERFIVDRYTLEQRGKILVDQSLMAKNWLAMAELGWLAAPLPESLGGLGIQPMQITGLLEVLGAGLVLEPLSAVMQCAVTLARALPEEKAIDRLNPILSGARIEVMAEGASGNPITARGDGETLDLAGMSPLVMGGSVASTFWVVVENDGVQALCPVPATAAKVEHYRLLDGQPVARVVFDGVTVRNADTITSAGAALRFGADLGCVAILAESAGVIDALYCATLDYVKLREQFGRPIGRFQVVQHRMADMFIAREEARSMMQLAAEAQDSEDESFRIRLISAARVKIADNARKVQRDAVQLHGGMGVTDELPVGHMVKRLLVLAQLGGNRQQHLERFNAAA